MIASNSHGMGIKIAFNKLIRWRESNSKTAKDKPTSATKRAAQLKAHPSTIKEDPHKKNRGSSIN